MKSKTDKRLVKDFLKGNEDSFTELYNRHKSYVIALIRKISSKVDPDDLAQEVWLRVATKAHTWRHKAKFTTWLGRIIYTCILMEARNNKRVYSQTSTNTISLESILAQKQFDNASSNDLAILAVESDTEDNTVNRLTIEKLIENIPPGYKQFLRLKSQGYQFKEMAEIQGCHIGNAKSQVHQGIAYVRKAMGAKAGC